MAEQLTNAAEYTVSEIAQAVRRTVEENFDYVRVRGEISGYRGQHSSGHAYFTLKDADASIDAVVWRGSFARLAFKPEEGLEIIATGRLTTFPRSSKYQIVIENIEPAGAGALMALVEERRKKLAAEGLFAKERKRPLPYLPRVIGVVTSPTGAVIRDILHRLEDRFPTHVIVWPVRVQGDTCAPEVSAAIAGFNALPEDGPIARPDLLIVARGGGSIEDLWGFNEEMVVRAVAASRIPIISAVGHETDTTLIDYAADMRAPTPTAAAEAAVPVRSELIAYVDDQGARQRMAARRILSNYRDRLRAASAGLPRPADLIATAQQRLDHASSNLLAALRHAKQIKEIQLARVTSRLSLATLEATVHRARLRYDPVGARAEPAFKRMVSDRRQRIDSLGKLLLTLGYKSVLARGYAIVKDAGGELVRGKEFLAEGDALRIEFADGEVPVTVGEGAGPSGRPLPSVKPKKPRPSQDRDDEQPDLF
ncbi:exodeoxyribonuclease VII large subunit [Paradevosia shaoguanensis]|uniref:exodeoxyribonuclease VII large subunit n=1 Tax=Paradevosia shaoguanensis TaxID=1335043 RepID=UPI003C78DD2D